jgi:copper chaperone CopZ
VSELETIRFPIEGMTCSSCVNQITRALRRLEGVGSVAVDLSEQTATIRRDASLVPDDVIANVVAEAGYKADLGAVVSVPWIERPNLAARLWRRGR